MYKSLIKILFCFCLIFVVISKINAEEAYWQQQADYKINVSLNDRTHELDGDLRINYHNNSPDSLSVIYLHLWQNAFSSDSTAFSKQLLDQKNISFYHSKPEQKGSTGISNLKINNVDVSYLFYDGNSDIIEIQLAEHIAPESKIEISADFAVKISDVFSRSGHDKQFYQITQWYPKIANYDKEGWHMMPYLDQGEYYNCFGDYDVNITIPENYKVAATGELTTSSEIKWIEEIAATSKKYDADSSFPASSNKIKTINFIAKNVHDFAWFADKRYLIDKSEIALNDGSIVNTYVYYLSSQTEIWNNACQYINNAIKFYSDAVGNYPYKNCTAVSGELFAGGAMEYPMITIIGKTRNKSTLERYIVHEAGHNWFQGILASNERKHPFMDESINSYYENRYFEEMYPNLGLIEDNNEISERLHISKYKAAHRNELGYLASAALNRDQAINLSSTGHNALNYGLMVYAKGAAVFNYLEKFLGKNSFDPIMKKYFSKWKFKHPQPEDLESVFKESSPKYLDWFFRDLLESTKKVDYSISKIDDKEMTIGDSRYTKLYIKNKGQVKSPFSIAAVKNDKTIYQLWYDGFMGESEVLIPKLDADKYVIDRDLVTLDVNRQNNSIKTKGPFKKMESLLFQPLVSLNNDDFTQIHYTPVLGYNAWDKFMLGVIFHSGFITPKKWEYSLAPQFAFGTNTLVGFGNLHYNFFPGSSRIENIRVGISGRSYTDNSISILTNDEYRGTALKRFIKLQPEVELFFYDPKANTSNKKSGIKLRSINIINQLVENDVTKAYPDHDNKPDNYYVNELAYYYDKDQIINPYGFQVMLEQGDRYFKTSIEGKYCLSYSRKKNKGLRMRLFATAFLQRNFPDKFNVNNQLSSNSDNFNFDYKYDHFYLGRNKFFDADKFKFYNHQIENINNANFKSIGYTRSGNDFEEIVSLNLYFDIPKTPVYFYANYAFYDDQNGIANLDEYGFTLEIIRDAFEINFPIFPEKWSDDLYTVARKQNYFDKITFSLNLRSLDVFKLIRKIELN